MNIGTKRIISLDNLAIALGSPAQEVLYLAQEGESLALQPGDPNIFIDVDKFMKHLDDIINEEIRKVNQNTEKWRNNYENNRY